MRITTGWKRCGCLFLFGLPFVGVGIGIGSMVYGSIVTAIAMRSWEEIPSIILSTGLETSTDEDGTTFRVAATYSYVYQGRAYTGKRVSIDENYDNVGSYHRRMYARLLRTRVSAENATCYVDPKHPESSVLDRHLRWELVATLSIISLVFAGAGIGIIAAGIVMRGTDESL